MFWFGKAFSTSRKESPPGRASRSWKLSLASAPQIALHVLAVACPTSSRSCFAWSTVAWCRTWIDASEISVPSQRRVVPKALAHALLRQARHSPCSLWPGSYFGQEHGTDFLPLVQQSLRAGSGERSKRPGWRRLWGRKQEKEGEKGEKRGAPHRPLNHSLA